MKDKNRKWQTGSLVLTQNEKNHHIAEMEQHAFHSVIIHKRLMWIILVCKLKFNIFTIRESIWRVFFLRPNYRHNSDMISVDRICILEILDHVRLKFVVFTIRKMIWRVFLR
ncbi:hypothetical protein DERP_014596 [Dermatophagoides pteronyssinus]|uniref:Uncharacterized protein n=1 Tax=Dermatophagoides pteronyssinus TaxID=6956 RepID=A0ABQ8IW21_DERPT|nr:hypothetical protein DERP_014596 [Dermatophagoides pteronyssinus]